MNEQMYISRTRYGRYTDYNGRRDCEPTGRWRIDKTYSGTDIVDTVLYLEVIWYEEYTWYFIPKFPFIKKQLLKEKRIEWEREDILCFYDVYKTETGKIENCNNISGEASENKSKR